MTKETQTHVFAASDLDSLWQKRPFIISGPCSAETEEQVLAAAEQIAATQRADLMRAGVWKPRTKPGMFEGAGGQALEWLIKAKARTGLPFCVEVANVSQTEQALRAGTDVLWIGARTTVNPFSVQEIADALRGVDIPVLIKNPTHPDIDLWTGAVERLARAGINKIGLIHRGFSVYGNREYRNAPMWHLAIEMKRRFPDLMMICDPSHICGRRDTLQAVAQKAIDLDFDGLMLETHPNPDEAWSDAKQQITPERFREIIDSLIWRNEDAPSDEYHQALDTLREQINHLDDEIFEVLSRRMALAREIALLKKQNNVTILQTNRWNEMLERAKAKKDKMQLSDEFIHKWIEVVHWESIRQQKKILDEPM
jgi:chorismate mutase